MITEHRYDVVIVGAGGAGMRAALESSPRARTAVLTLISSRATLAAIGSLGRLAMHGGRGQWCWWADSSTRRARSCRSDRRR